MQQQQKHVEAKRKNKKKKTVFQIKHNTVGVQIEKVHEKGKCVGMCSLHSVAFALHIGSLELLMPNEAAQHFRIVL